MKNLYGVAFIQVENNLIFPKSGVCTKDGLGERDVVIYEHEIEELAEIEMSSGSHEEEIENDLSNDEIIKFYTENVVKEDYLIFIKNKLDDKNLSNKSLQEIADSVYDYIKNSIQNS